MTQTRIEKAAAELDAHSDYRVLRRLQARPILDERPAGSKIAIVLDAETTGVDVAKDEVIELGMVQVAYEPSGRILGVLGTFEGFQQPTVPISEEITRLTGIDDAMVEGHAIDQAALEAFVAPADLIIAHNAAFDRPMVERRWNVFADKHWACSMSEIDWKVEGFDGFRLGLLLMQCGMFHDGHRSVVDCHAVVELLAHIMPSGKSGMAVLLENARRTRWRIDATGTPYDSKDVLKRRGYRWNGEEGNPPKSWHKEVHSEDGEAELAFLRTDVYRSDREPLVRKVTSKNRFTDRL